jgi:ketosteroid isomerase-like protein
MMKLTLIATALAFTVIGLASAQGAKQDDDLEREIRKLEQAQVDAGLRGDVAAMKKNWAEDYVVNNPFYEAVDASKGPIAAGTLRYSSFVREVERVLLRGDTVIVMGREVVVPKGDSPDAGKTINRRFTNIWMKRGGRWLLTARHASIVCRG